MQTYCSCYMFPFQISALKTVSKLYFNLVTKRLKYILNACILLYMMNREQSFVPSSSFSHLIVLLCFFMYMEVTLPVKYIHVLKIKHSAFAGSDLSRLIKLCGISWAWTTPRVLRWCLQRCWQWKWRRRRRENGGTCIYVKTVIIYM